MIGVPADYPCLEQMYTSKKTKWFIATFENVSGSTLPFHFSKPYFRPHYFSALSQPTCPITLNEAIQNLIRQCPRMLESIGRSSTTPAQSYSTTKDEEVKVDQNTASTSKAVGAVKATESPDAGLEKQDANKIPDSASEKQEHDEDSGKGSNVDTRWERMFTRLLAYKEKHGDCVVPNRYSDDTQLGSWVSTQRRHYKGFTSEGKESSPMSLERVGRLVEIGFQWAIKDPRYVPWETRYDELVAFIKEHGHAQVPIGYEKNAQLSNWVSTQRQEYKMLERGRSSRLTDDRIKLLNKVDFVWEAQRGGPKRKRKAAVSVPPEPKPANKTKRRQLRAGQYASFQGHSNTMASFATGMNAMPMQMFLGHAGAIPLATAAVNRDNSLTQMPSHPWPPMMNGAFQQVPSMGPHAPSYFPMAPPGYHFGLVPNLSFPQSLNADAAQTGGKIQAKHLVSDGTWSPNKPKEDDDGDGKSATHP